MLAEADELKNANGKLKPIERTVLVAEEVENRVRAVEIVERKSAGDMKGMNIARSRADLRRVDVRNIRGANLNFCQPHNEWKVVGKRGGGSDDDKQYLGGARRPSPFKEDN